MEIINLLSSQIDLTIKKLAPYTVFGISPETFFSSIKTQKECIECPDFLVYLEYGHTRFLGEILLLDSQRCEDNPLWCAMVQNIQRRYGVKKSTREKYFAFQKQFRRMSVFDVFGKELPEHVAFSLGESLVVNHTLQIFHEEYRKLLLIRHDREKEIIASLYREYHFLMFLLWIRKVGKS